MVLFLCLFEAVCSSELPVRSSWSLGCSTIRHLCFWLLDETTCSTPCHWAGTVKKVLALSLFWSRKLTHSVALANFVSSYHLSVRLVWKGWLLSCWCHWSIILSVCHFGEQIKCSPSENCPSRPPCKIGGCGYNTDVWWFFFSACLKLCVHLSYRWDHHGRSGVQPSGICVFDSWMKPPARPHAIEQAQLKRCLLSVCFDQGS